MGNNPNESDVDFNLVGGVRGAVSKRRYSPRLRDILKHKRPGNRDKLATRFCKQLDYLHNERMSNANRNAKCVDIGDIVDLEDNSRVKLKWTHYDSFVADAVKETTTRSNDSYLDFVQKQTQASNLSDANTTEKILTTKEKLYPKVKLGLLPGIVAGHRFFSRAEMVAIGFELRWLTGIDYLRKYSKRLMQNNSTPYLAVAVVLSYTSRGDVDGKHEVVYIHQGGIKLPCNTQQEETQYMLGASSALKNNMEQCIPVRLICGQKCSDKNGSKEYTYCGLYKIMNRSCVESKHGQSVFTYRLKKLLGEPNPTTNQIPTERGRQSTLFTKLPGLVSEDISFGEEALKIPVRNTVDSPPIAPSDFKYCKSIQVATGVIIPPSASGCKCNGSCTNPKTCACAQLNGFDFPYVNQDGGRLIEAKDVVYECGPGCGCGSKCINRVSQRGLKYQLEVYRTKRKGWAVRSWDPIPAGAPVCEYTGLLRSSAELDSVCDNDYIFDIDCLHTMHGIGGREKREAGVSVASCTPEKVNAATLPESESEFCIDAGSCGNVARFINHSCEPNLFVECILSSHHDLRLARIVLFAAEDIPPMDELTYDYGYELGSVTDEDGNVKELECHCGTSECRGRLY
ncbi:Histone-lysine N-methyltransferase, H3 lysine-9 specific SUVH4 [Linum grandiflorum]